MTPVYFETPDNFRKWMEKHHDKEKELLVGFYRKSTGRKSIDWPQSVDVALSFGWIDGIRKGIDEESYSIRFTPRKKGSIWSAVNLRKAEELKAAGLMQPAGLKAYENRDPEKSNRYSFEQGNVAFSEEEDELFRSNSKAWHNFHKMAPSYRKPATWWVISAKRQDTREKRLRSLIAHSENGEKIPLLRVRKRGE